MTTHPIGIFDSGVGGLTVMKSLAEQLPNESIIYFGDTARLPYGDKSPQVIEKYTNQCIQFLLQQQVKMVIIACNTASAFTAKKLKDSLHVPVFDVIEPSSRQACIKTRNGNIGVLGTHATIRSGCYQKAIHAILPQANIIPIACPMFVPLVEEMLVEHPATQMLAYDYLKPIREAKVDTLILGCTHYPLLKNIISQNAGEGVNIVDSADCCAQAVLSLIQNPNLSGIANYNFFVSDDCERFKRLASAFLPEGLAPKNVHLCMD